MLTVDEARISYWLHIRAMTETPSRILVVGPQLERTWGKVTASNGLANLADDRGGTTRVFEKKVLWRPSNNAAIVLNETQVVDGFSLRGTAFDYVWVTDVQGYRNLTRVVAEISKTLMYISAGPKILYTN